LLRKGLLLLAVLWLLAPAGCGSGATGPTPGTSPVPGGEGALDLAPYARVTASGTRRTFLGLWARETDDAPGTVRDGDPATGWKTPPQGQSTLVLDFRPLLLAPPAVSRLEADWDPPPRGPVEARFLSSCGGEPGLRVPWEDPLSPLVMTDPAAAGCLELALADPGAASLTGLRALAAACPGRPELRGAGVSALGGNGVRLSWEPASDCVFLVEVHYTGGPGDAPGPGTRVDTVPAVLRAWQGPLPARESRHAVLVPVGPDGLRGPPASLLLPERAGEPARFPWSGVVEGFYGRPWSHRERRALILRLARCGMGIYVYAPKHDPLHREDWRSPYPDEALERFAELDRLARALGVTFSLGISPGRDMNPQDPAEEVSLLAKLAPFVEMGFRHFALLMDDIESDLESPVDGALGRWHAALANRLEAALADRAGEPVALWFVPTVYSTERQERWAGGRDYVDALRGLDAGISVMWTGTDTLSPALSARDLEEVTARTGRRVVIWENQHATDGGDGFFGKLYLAPYGRRAADLPAAVEGIVANPMIPGAADRLVLGTYAAFLSDPRGYDAETARQDSVAMEALEPGDRRLALWWAGTFHGSGVLGLPGLNLPRNPALDEAVHRFRAALGAGDRAGIQGAGRALLVVAARMAAAQGELHHSGLEPSLVDDLWAPGDRLAHEGEALLWMLRMAGERLSGRQGLDAAAAARGLLDLAWHDRYPLSLLEANLLLAFLDGFPAREQGFRAPGIRLADSRPPVTGAPWRLRPCEEGRVEVFGLPGGEVQDGTVSWTPGHPGTYQAVLAVSTDEGWAWERLRLVVR